MESNEIKEQINEILSKVLNQFEPDQINATDSLTAIGMDSLNYVQFIVLLEDFFQISVPDELFQIESVNSLENIYHLVVYLQSSGGVPAHV